MALSVIKANSFKEISDINFSLGEAEKWQILCPNPTIADSIRKKIEDHCEKEKFTTNTISKFLTDTFQEAFSDEIVVRKSELMKKLATLWKLRFSGFDSSFFHQAFEVFTDLRSFTLNKDIAAQVIDYYPEIIKQAVTLFWLVCDEERIIDEHQAYSDLTEYFQSVDILESSSFLDSSYVVIGFTHMSAGQIELLKVIGQRVDVVIPVHSEVFRDCLYTDWLSWLQSQADHIVEKKTELKKEHTVNVREFTPINLNSTLLEEMDESNQSVFFPMSNISFSTINKIHANKFFFRSDVDLFGNTLYETKEGIEKKLIEHGEQKTVEVISFLEDELKKTIASSKDWGVFKKIKVYQTLIDSLKGWLELSEVNETFSTFDLNIVSEVSKLDLPRNFNLPILENAIGDIFSLKDLYRINDDKNLIIVALSKHDLTLGGSPNYPKEVQEILVNLGPMRRKSLDYLFYSFHIREILDWPKVTLMIEEGLWKHDQAWAMILENMVMKPIDEGEQTKAFVKRVGEQKRAQYLHEKPLSATRLQTYLDCPKKFYYNYVISLGAEPPKLNMTDPRDLGSAEHKVVQCYLEAYENWDETSFEKVLDQEMTNFFPHLYEENQLAYLEARSEVSFYSEQTIKELLKFKLFDHEIKFYFEQSMEVSPGVGSADIVIETAQGNILFDMKRSGGSIPTNSDILKMKAIQLWYYLAFLKEEPESFIAFGYLNLSDNEESRIYCLDNTLGEFIGKNEVFGIKKLETIKEPLLVYLEQFNEVLGNAESKLKNQEDFNISPKNAGVCTFCPGNMICDRGSIND